MCSIYGIIKSENYEKNLALLKMMAQDQFHRGPDDGGEFVSSDRRVILGHRRLSIIDLNHEAAQPMLSDDGNTTIVFNGEIYNFQTLRSELEAENFTFRTRSDTEVIIKLYQRYGIDFVKKLNGMFAMAIYDRKNEKTFLIRDKLGKKPLFYHVNSAGELIFASELSAIKLKGDLELNHNAISSFLSFQAIYGVETIYKNVFKLAPSSIMEIDLKSGNSQIYRYYELNLNNKTEANFLDCQTALRGKISEAVKMRLISDVPTGIFLSGGIDSNIVAALATQLSENEKIHAFTIGFENPAYDETKIAQQSADFINKKFNNKLIHHIKTVNPSDFGILSKLAKHYGEPFADASMIPSYYLSQFARENITVALSGDGGDEFFAGYNRYAIMQSLKVINLIPAKLRKGIFGNLSKLCRNANERSFGNRLYRLMQTFSQTTTRQYMTIFDRAPIEIKRSICNFNLDEASNIFDTFQDVNAKNIVEKCQEFDQKNYLWSDIFAKVDIASMANSLEVRSPLLDDNVVDYANSLPLDYKLHKGNKKYILKKAFADSLSDSVLNGSKKGFAVPLGDFFRNEWRAEIQAHLLEGKLVSSGLFKRDELANLISNDTNLERYSHLIFSLVILDLSL